MLIKTQIVSKRQASRRKESIRGHVLWTVIFSGLLIATQVTQAAPAMAAPTASTATVVRTFALSEQERLPQTIKHNGQTLFLIKSKEVGQEQPLTKQVKQSGTPIQIPMEQKATFAALRDRFSQSYRVEADGFEATLELVDINVKVTKTMQDQEIWRTQLSAHDKATTDAVASEITESMPDGTTVTLYLQDVEWTSVEGSFKKGDFSEPLGTWQATAYYSGMWRTRQDRCQFVYPIYRGVGVAPVHKQCIRATYAPEREAYQPQAQIQTAGSDPEFSARFDSANAQGAQGGRNGLDSGQEGDAMAQWWDRAWPAVLSLTVLANIVALSYLLHKRFPAVRRAPGIKQAVDAQQKLISRARVWWSV